MRPETESEVIDAATELVKELSCDDYGDCNGYSHSEWCVPAALKCLLVDGELELQVNASHEEALKEKERREAPKVPPPPCRHSSVRMNYTFTKDGGETFSQQLVCASCGIKMEKL